MQFVSVRNLDSVDGEETYLSEAETRRNSDGQVTGVGQFERERSRVAGIDESGRRMNL